MEKKSCSILQQFTGRKCVTLFDVRRCNDVFARYKQKEYMQTLALQLNLSRDFFSAMAESLRNLKDTNVFRRWIEIDQL